MPGRGGRGELLQCAGPGPTFAPTRWLFSVVESRPFDLLVFPFWSIFSRGPKRLTFYLQVLWASECLLAFDQRIWGELLPSLGAVAFWTPRFRGVLDGKKAVAMKASVLVFYHWTYLFPGGLSKCSWTS